MRGKSDPPDHGLTHSIRGTGCEDRPYKQGVIAREGTPRALRAGTPIAGDPVLTVGRLTYSDQTRDAGGYWVARFRVATRPSRAMTRVNELPRARRDSP